MGAKQKIIEAIAERAKAGEPVAMDYVKSKISAWHGSPHDFDKFQTSQIGTGEGAQAYGHGLYFAESQDVARGYRETLSGKDYTFNGDRYSPGKAGANASPEEYAASALSRFDGDVDKAKEWLDGIAVRWEGSPSVGDPRAAINVLNKRDVETVSSGSLFNVNIDATPDELLDWDKPLSEQPAGIRGQLQAYIDSVDDQDKVRRVLGDDPKGGDIYELEEMMADNTTYSSGSVPPVTSKKLTDMGIKGIQYDDAMSRGAEGGTKNYVIFDDKLIDIAKKYGVSLPVAASMVGADMPRSEAALLPPVNMPDDTIEAPKHGTLTGIGEFLQGVEDPLGNPYQSTANVLNKWGYGESADTMDLLFSPTEFLDPSNIPALYGEVVKRLRDRQ